MKRRVLLLLVAVAAGTAGAVSAQASLVVGADPVTHYVWRGIDVLEGGAPVQPWATATLGGLSLTAWGSFGTVDREHRIGAVERSDLDELDLTLSYSRPAGPLLLSVGGIHYSYLSAGYPNASTTTYEGYVGVGIPGLPFAPSLTLYHDFNLGDGQYLALTGARPVDVGRPLDLSWGIGYMDQAWRPEPGISDLSVGAGLPFTVGRVALAPSLNYTYSPASGALPAARTLWARLRLSAAPLALD